MEAHGRIRRVGGSDDRDYVEQETGILAMGAGGFGGYSQSICRRAPYDGCGGELRDIGRGGVVGGDFRPKEKQETIWRAGMRGVSVNLRSVVEN